MKRLLDLLFGISFKKRSQLPVIDQSDVPATVEEAISLMQEILPKNVQDEFRATKEEDLWRLHFSLGAWTRNNLHLWDKNSEIRKQIGTVCADNASSVIIWSFWSRLQQDETSPEKAE